MTADPVDAAEGRAALGALIADAQHDAGFARLVSDKAGGADLQICELAGHLNSAGAASAKAKEESG